MECDLGQGWLGHNFRMKVSIGFLGLFSLFTPCLAISDTKSGCCWKLGMILFPFLLVARYAVSGKPPCWLSQWHWGYPVASGATTIWNLLKYKLCSIPGSPRRSEIGETFEGAAIDEFYLFYKHVSPLAGSQALNKFNEGCVEESLLTKVSLNP